MSYSLVYRRVTAGEVPSKRDESSVITVARRDVKLLERGPPADTDRKAVMLGCAPIASATRRGSARPAIAR